MKNILILNIGLLTLFSCKKKEVESCFETSSLEVFTLDPIQFDNCSENAVETQWNFGDGNNSDFLSPSHKFEKAGEYTVILTAFDKKHNISTAEHTIKVADLRLSEINFEGIDFLAKKYIIDYHQFGTLIPWLAELETETTNEFYHVRFKEPLYMEKEINTLNVLEVTNYDVKKIVNWTFDCFKEIDQKTKQLILKDKKTGLTATLTFIYTY